MAKVNPVSICPTCNTELPYPQPETCPGCQQYLKRSKPSEKFGFACPDYLYFQKEEVVRTDPRRSKTEAEKRKAQEAAKELHEWARKTTPEEKAAALFDALLVMQNLIHSPVSPDHMRRITPLAKRIGELGGIIESYYRTGGMSLEYREVGPLRPGPADDSGGEKSTP